MKNPARTGFFKSANSDFTAIFWNPLNRGNHIWFKVLIHEGLKLQRFIPAYL